MAASLLQLNTGLAFLAFLPACLFPKPHGAFSRLMPLVIANAAYLGVAFVTCGTGTAIVVMEDVLTPDSCPTFPPRTYFLVASFH